MTGLNTRCEEANINMPTFPAAGACERDDNLYYNSQTLNQLQEEQLQRYENLFRETSNSQLGDLTTKHEKLSCILRSMLAEVRNNYEGHETDLDALTNRLNREQTHLQQQEARIKTNEDSELVTKYRNESSAARNKKMTTEFTIYVTMIVVFLIVEGIVFFV